MLKQAVDFKNESDYLHDILADLSEADLETSYGKSPFKGWSS